jgi:16S rRNA G966 N2-methylase RsmD
MLSPSTVVIAEHDKKLDLEERVGALERYRKHEQGDATLSFYRLG